MLDSALPLAAAGDTAAILTGLGPAGAVNRKSRFTGRLVSVNFG